MNLDGRLRIGELATATETKVVTIRYYEQVGLLPAPSRTAGNYRAYKQEHIRRLKFIRRCRNLGFTLDQVRDLLRLSSQEDQDCGEVDRITGKHLEEMQRKIAGLRKLAAELRRLKQCCPGNVPIADCRILEALSPEAPKRSA